MTVVTSFMQHSVHFGVPKSLGPNLVEVKATRPAFAVKEVEDIASAIGRCKV